MNHLLAIALVTTALATADATGTWTGTLTPSGGTAGPARLVLKQDGDKLTGTAGPDASEQHPIENGRVENDTLMFELTSPGGVMKFTLRQDGEEMTGDITREREGQTQTARIVVKRTQ